MFAAKGNDFRSLALMSKKELSLTNEQGETILHIIAKTKNIDFLFAVSYIGCNQLATDNNGNAYTVYLQEWERDKMSLLDSARKAGKLQINSYKDTFDMYLPNTFSVSGVPSFCIIWERNLGIDILSQLLDTGIDLDNYYIRIAKPPPDYRKLLIKYGWVGLDERNTQLSEAFYPASLWTPALIDDRFTVSPIEAPPVGVVSKTLVCISDIHWQHRKLHIPGGDVLICAGDICTPFITDATDFLVWMGKQQHPFHREALR